MPHSLPACLPNMARATPLYDRCGNCLQCDTGWNEWLELPSCDVPRFLKLIRVESAYAATSSIGASSGGL